MLFFVLLFMGLGVLGMVAGIGLATVASVIAAGSISSGAVFAILSALLFVSGTVLVVGGSLRKELVKLRRGLAIVVSESTERAQRDLMSHAAARPDESGRATDSEPRRRRVRIGGGGDGAVGDDRSEPVLSPGGGERLGAPGPRAVR